MRGFFSHLLSLADQRRLQFRIRYRIGVGLAAVVGPSAGEHVDGALHLPLERLDPFLDACIPPDAAVVVESRAADTLSELPQLAWSTEPAPYLRDHGPELPFRATVPPGPEGQAGTWELLFQNAVGRFLQLRVTLRGNGRITPRIRGVRAYYPRFSYLREYLPAAWREDARFNAEDMYRRDGYFDARVEVALS